MDRSMPQRFHSVTGIGREVLATTAGILLALTPLALWIAWSPQIMALVLVGAALAACVAILCWPGGA